MAFVGLIFANEFVRRAKFRGITCFHAVPVMLTASFIAIYIGTAAAMDTSMPATADPRMQGVISIASIAVNALAWIVKRSIEQKKNPYTNEIFSDTKDFQLAMARREK